MSYEFGDAFASLKNDNMKNQYLIFINYEIMDHLYPEQNFVQRDFCFRIFKNIKR